MNREGHSQVDFFIGREVEHSPAFGHHTLFVVGIQDASVIINLVKNNNCTHVYFGANQSFPNPDINDGPTWREWEEMIQECLQVGLLCTLDLDSTCAEGLVESGLVDYNNFIPMISVKLPYVQLLGYNATIKIDDIDFAKSNPGVWCHSLHELRDRAKFTDWSKYTQDEIIK
jgi:hypothetical protein